LNFERHIVQHQQDHHSRHATREEVKALFEGVAVRVNIKVNAVLTLPKAGPPYRVRLRVRVSG